MNQKKQSQMKMKKKKFIKQLFILQNNLILYLKENLNKLKKVNSQNLKKFFQKKQLLKL